MLLEGKNAIIYGARGGIGGGVARTDRAAAMTGTIVNVTCGLVSG
jgi:hypothetical protein